MRLLLRFKILDLTLKLLHPVAGSTDELSLLGVDHSRIVLIRSVSGEDRRFNKDYNGHCAGGSDQDEMVVWKFWRYFLLAVLMWWKRSG